MSHALTEVATYGATVTVPDDGDNEVAASVVTAFQTLANRAAYFAAQFATAASFLGTLAVTGTTTLGVLFVNTGIDVVGTFVAAGTAVFNGAAAFTAGVTLGTVNGVTAFNGAFSRRVSAGVNANHTYSVASTDIVLNTIALGAGSTWLLDGAGATAGMSITLVYASATGSTVLVQDIGGTTPGVTLAPSNSVGVSTKAATFFFDGTVWRVGHSAQ